MLTSDKTVPTVKGSAVLRDGLCCQGVHLQHGLGTGTLALGDDGVKPHCTTFLCAPVLQFALSAAVRRCDVIWHWELELALGRAPYKLLNCVK